MALVYMDGDGVGDTEPRRSQQHGGGHYNGEGGAIQKGNELVGTAEKGHDENAGEQDIDQPAFFYAEVEHERQFNGHQKQDKTGNDERAQQRCVCSDSFIIGGYAPCVKIFSTFFLLFQPYDTATASCCKPEPFCHMAQ